MADPNIFRGSVRKAWLSHPLGRYSTLLITTTTTSTNTNNTNTTTTTSGKKFPTLAQSGPHSLLPSLVAAVEEIPKPVGGHWNYGTPSH